MKGAQRPPQVTEFVCNLTGSKNYHCDKMADNLNAYKHNLHEQQT